jgi:hypothetical protein
MSWCPHTYIKVCLSIDHNIEAKKDPLQGFITFFQKMKLSIIYLFQ